MKYIKNELKELRKEIREVRLVSREANDVWDRASAQRKLLYLKHLYRVRHILYCLMKGRNYLEIEHSTREGNEVYVGSLQLVCKDYPTLNWDEISKEQLEGLL